MANPNKGLSESKHVVTHPKRQARRERALVRQEAAAKRTPQEQLDLLIERGHGHCIEAQTLIEKLGLDTPTDEG